MRESKYTRRVIVSALKCLVCLALVGTLAGCRHSSFPDYPVGYREFAYVANHGSNTVTVLDLVYLRPDRTLEVGTKPVALAANPVRDEIYVLNEGPEGAGGSLAVIDARQNRVAATIALHRNPTAVAVDPAGKRAYVANTGSNTVSVVDLGTRRTVASFAVGERPGGIKVSPDGRTLVVTNAGSGNVQLFALGGAAPATLRQTFTGCAGAADPVILPNSSKTFVACAGGHQVLALGLALAPDDANLKQDANLAQDRVLALLDVGQNPTHLTMKPDGGEIFVSNGAANSISEIATETNEVGNTQAIGNRPGKGVVARDGGMLWVPDTGADSVSAYSIDDGKLVANLKTGVAPAAVAFSAEQNLLLAADKGSGDVAVIRTTSRQGPAALFTLMPAGAGPCAVVVMALGK